MRIDRSVRGGGDIKHSERSNELDTVLYINNIFYVILLKPLLSFHCNILSVGFLVFH